MASWDNWMPELLLAAPAAPTPLVHQCLNRAARAFLKQTRAWQEWLEPMDIAGAGFTEYTFELPQGAELLRMERATLNGQPLAVANARDLPSDPWRYAQDGQAYLVSTDLRNFTVLARNPAGGAFQAYVSLVPSLRGTMVPDSVASLYHEAIREGAKAELLNTAGTDYYKPDQAAVSLAFFQRAIDEGTTDVWRSSTARVSRGRTSWL
jgi:hypothetical protein